MENTNGHGAVETVLIVDDSEAGAVALELACATIPGVGVRRVFSALEAVRILGDPARPVSAVVTDIRMPRMDGFDLIRFIRADRRLAATPIVVVSADTDPDTPARTARLGADAYFAKPFSPRAVRETLERLLHVNPSAE